MELREMITFLEVARQRSFSRAAKNLGYSQAAVTIQIKQLESELGVYLFDRIGKQTTMTHQGVIFYEYAAGIVRDLEMARQAVAQTGELTGELCVGTVESICAAIFPELLQTYHRLHPKVNIRVILDTPENLLKRMDQNTLDFVYLLDKRVCSGTWVKALEEAENVRFLAGVAHPLAGKRGIRLEEMVHQSFLLTEKDVSYRLILDQFLASQGLEITPFLEIGNTDYIIRQLILQEGVSFLPEFTVHAEVSEGKLAVLDVKDFHMQVWRQILYHKDKWVTREMEEFFRLAGGTDGRAEAGKTHKGKESSIHKKQKVGAGL